jgi:Protein of unknown function (DUF3237)
MILNRPVALEPGLAHLFTLSAGIGSSDDTGDGTLGRRVRDSVGEGTFAGARLRGELLPGSADWRLIRRDITSIVDARVMLRTDDGALIYMSYGGRIVVPPEVLAQARDPERRHLLDPATYYFRTAPVFETGAESYRWLNNIVCLGTGRLTAKGVDYDIFEVL